MDKMHDGAGTEMPVQDRALRALADLLEQLGEEAAQAWLRGGPGDDATFTECAKRAEVVARAITGLPSVTIHGAAEKVRAVRSRTPMALLPPALVDALGMDMAADMYRLHQPSGEVVGHA
jgi:hypothetical protein